MKYDAVFIGGGGAAYPGAFELAKGGFKVLMVDEKGNLGGDCLYAGCIPSKAVITKVRRIVEVAKDLGLKVDRNDAWRRAIELKEKVQDIRYDQHMKEIEEHAPNLEFVKGWATIKSKNRVVVEGDRNVDAETRYLVIAAGSENVRPPIPGAELAWTSDDLYAYRKARNEIPGSMVVIGAGAIGMEAADLLASLGVEVTVVEMLDGALKTVKDVDREPIEAAVNKMAGKGVKFMFSTTVSRIERADGGFSVRYTGKGGEGELKAEGVLMAVGRRPRLKGYGLENVGAKVEGGAIWIDDTMETSVPGVYATGDVNARKMFFHSAVKMSVVAARNIAMGRNVYHMNFKSVPVDIFVYPEIGSVGMTEEEAREKGINYGVVKFGLAGDAQSQIVNERGGFLKFIYEKETLRLLGIHAYSHDAAELSAVFALSMEMGLTARDLAWMCGPHPLTFESVNYALRSFF